jgi:thiosulfate/3-mercaptopyruvate sulfurtransferase
MPGAVNIPYSQYFNNETKLIKSSAELLDLFKQNSIDLNKSIITSCMTGMKASTAALATHIAGSSNTAVYYGSWTEYSQKKKK